MAAADDEEVAGEAVDRWRADAVCLDPGDPHTGEPRSLALGHGLPRRGTGVDRHPARGEGVAERAPLRVHTQVHHRRHLDACIQQVEGAP